jgi:hypothetical protein
MRTEGARRLAAAGNKPVKVCIPSDRAATQARQTIKFFQDAPISDSAIHVEPAELRSDLGIGMFVLTSDL